MAVAARAAAGKSPQSLGEVLDALRKQSRASGKRVTVKCLLEELGPRSYGPLLLVPSLLALIPIIGGIPGMSILTGTLIIIIAAQLLFARSSPWMPQMLLNISLPRDKLTSAIDRSKRWVKPIDRVVTRRFSALVRPPGLQVVAAALIVLGLLFYPTELIPWGVTAPALAATVLALAVTAKDGILVVIGYIMTAASIGFVIMLWPF